MVGKAKVVVKVVGKAAGALNPVNDIETVKAGVDTFEQCARYLNDTIYGSDQHKDACGGSAANLVNQVVGDVPVVGGGIQEFITVVTSPGQAGSSTPDPCWAKDPGLYP